LRRTTPSFFTSKNRPHDLQKTRIYAVSGPYDLVAILEAPDEKAVMKHGLFVAQSGYVDIVTMPATPIQDFMKTVAEVPKP